MLCLPSDVAFDFLIQFFFLTSPDQHPSMAIVKGAGMVMKAVIEVRYMYIL